MISPALSDLFFINAVLDALDVSCGAVSILVGIDGVAFTVPHMPDDNPLENYPGAIVLYAGRFTLSIQAENPGYSIRRVIAIFSPPDPNSDFVRIEITTRQPIEAFTHD